MGHVTFLNNIALLNDIVLLDQLLSLAFKEMGLGKIKGTFRIIAVFSFGGYR